MLIKTFYGDSLPEVFAQIRDEMGDDSVILEHRVVEHGPDGKPKYEVLAQRDTEPPPRRNAGLPAAELITRKQQELFGQVSPAAPLARREYLSGETFMPPPLPLAYPPHQAPLPGVAKHACRRPRRRRRQPPPAPQLPGLQAAAAESGTYTAAGVRSGANQHISKAMETAAVPDAAQLPGSLAVGNMEWNQLVDHLLDQDLDRAVAHKICESVQDEFGERPPVERPEIRIRVRNCIAREIRVAQPLRLGRGPNLVIMLGPTGVGKTTTAVKLAIKYSLNEYRRVAFLTTDTSRLAAAEQLNRYAEILKVPCHTAYNTDELQGAIEDMRDHDVIMVDTAGCSPNDKGRLCELQRWLSTLPFTQERFLVVSATTSRRDLYHIIEQFADLDYEKYIFTKLDETRGMGNILNLLQKSGKPAAYITNGQEVSGNIELISPDKVAANIIDGYGMEWN